MTYRISSFLIALMVLGSFAPAAHAAEPIHVTVRAGEPAPTCKARVSKKSITSGQDVRITWSSKNADQMYGLTKGGVWDADGNQKFKIGFVGKKVFQMVFVGDGGLATCNVTVHVHEKKDT